MPAELVGASYRCSTCGQELAEAASLLPASDSRVVPCSGITARSCEVAGKTTLQFSTCQSFVINPFPRRFELVLVEKIVARAASEIGPEAMLENSWFEGHAHRVLVCTHCEDHIGWSYKGRHGDTIYGLALSVSKFWAWLCLCALLLFAVYQVAAGGHFLVASATLLIALLKLSPHLLL
ncbi:unnamed protein product [Symbiodinium sp. CCMP2592]|nr:unnamed protein product [Symbiodinium microadriaticum]CAE7225869.1 unnamed protein product [Symbiodinium sp. CCMP2592]